jgi:hypothetical protein
MSAQTIVVDPVTRIEGHLRIEAEYNGSVITRASSSGTMVRGIEIILRGRDPRNAWAFAQRICGVCTLVHGIASVRAVEDALKITIPANAQEEPLEKHYVSRRSRSQKGILTFLARDSSERVLCYAHAGIPKDEQADEILRFVDFWQRQSGALPAELVFDSQLTTYANLNRLNQRGIRFLTLRRRSRRMLWEIGSRPASAWRRITLPALTRTFRTPRVLDERVRLHDYQGPLRQITIIDLGHEEPTILLTNNFRSGCPTLVTRYAQRMLIENGISEAIQFFHLDSLSSMVGLKVDFDLQLMLMASSLYRLLADKIGREYGKAQAKTIFRNLLDVSATVEIEEDGVVVTLDKRAHNPYLVASRLADEPTPMPWFGNRQLFLRFA